MGGSQIGPLDQGVVKRLSCAPFGLATEGRSALSEGDDLSMWLYIDGVTRNRRSHTGEGSLWTQTYERRWRAPLWAGSGRSVLGESCLSVSADVGDTTNIHTALTQAWAPTWTASHGLPSGGV
jgi:hypothetical protein